MHPTILKLGPLTLNSYGLMVAIAILVGMHLAKRQAKQESIQGSHVEGLSFWVVIAGLIGARFLYTFVEHGDYYWKHPIEFFYIHSGGLAFYGSLILGFPAAILYCRKNKLRFWQMVDILAPSLAIGLAIAKIGCFLAGCCHGKVCDLPWAVTFDHPETLARPKGVPLHPSQLYETIAWSLLYVNLIFIFKYRKYYGEIFLYFVIVFSIVRSMLEFVRGEPGHLGVLTTAQFLSIPLVIISAVIWWGIRKKDWSSQVPA